MRHRRQIHFDELAASWAAQPQIDTDFTWGKGVDSWRCRSPNIPSYYFLGWSTWIDTLRLRRQGNLRNLEQKRSSRSQQEPHDDGPRPRLLDLGEMLPGGCSREHRGSSGGQPNLQQGPPVDPPFGESWHSR